MKIEKIRYDKNIKSTPTSNPILYSLQKIIDKINEIIVALSCRKCGQVVALNYDGICIECFGKGQK